MAAGHRQRTSARRVCLQRRHPAGPRLLHAGRPGPRRRRDGGQRSGPGRFVLDVGSKVLGADTTPWVAGHGYLPDFPEASVPALSEHHATVVLPEGTEAPTLGSLVAVAPNHVCSAVNLVDELVLTQQGRVVDRWPIAARGANA
ncbi:hypothetical protein [Streptomyces capparidis]